MMADVLSAALGYLAAGLSVIPVRPDGTKAPAEAGWRAYSEQRPTADQVSAWFGNGHAGRYGIGIPGGPASGNLAVLDFETESAYVAWLKSLSKAADRRTRLQPLARTGGGGMHLYARLEEPVPGVVLARHVIDGKPRTLVEVRGNGMQVVAPGSPASCHRSGRPYEWLRPAWVEGGPWAPVPWDEWLEWLERAADLNEYTPPPEPNPPDTRARVPARAGTRPGDDFNHRGTWEETGLLEAGWTWHRRLGDDRGFLTRPGKDAGTSATVGMVSAADGGHPLFFCFSTNGAPFDHLKGYSRSRVYAFLKHKGDFHAATRALAERGYGGEHPRAPRAARGGAAAPDQPAIPATAPAEPKYRFIDHAEFRRADYRVDWFVDWFLARGQPAVVAGPSKGMKTSVLVDLAVSLATATPHLGRWAVRERVRTALVSGESGGYTLQETARRVTQAKGLAEDAPDGWLKWEFTLPTFADLLDTAEFARRLGDLGCELVVIDPFYLTLGEVDAKNMFEMGRALRAVGELLLAKHGVTPVIAHHANRLLPVGEPMELQHLAFSGLEQFVRQYVFLNRRAAYQNDGRHDLWYRYGGSAGHSGLYCLSIDEGVLGPDTPARRWDVEVTTQAEARRADADGARSRLRATAVERHAQDDQRVLLAIDAEFARHARPATEHNVLTRTGGTVGEGGIGERRVREALARLLECRAIEEVPTTRSAGKGEREYAGYQRTGGAS